MKERLFGMAIPLALGVIVFLSVRLTSPSEGRLLEILSSQVSVLRTPKVKVIYRELRTPQDIVPVRCDRVVPVTYTRVVSLADLPPEERKRRFVDLVLPSILIANYEVKFIRRNLTSVLLKLRRGFRLSREERDYVERILSRCREDSLESVLLKVNPVPPSIALAQAAVESGWGTSRFFVEGNNLFGMWTFRGDDGAMLAGNGKVFLRRFSSLLDSVRNYLYTVNVGWAYRDFRKARHRERDPLKLSRFLNLYSVERDRYVRKIRRIIRENNLVRFDLCSLDPDYLR